MGQQESISKDHTRKKKKSPKARIQETNWWRETTLQIARDQTQRFPGKGGREAKLAIQATDRERELKFNEGAVPQMNA